MTPSFNQGDYIEETIRSVLLQGYPNLNYLIIDGGSKDDSVAIIRKYERWLGYWVSEPDEGVTQALNKGFAKATGDLFGFMCADDYYLQEGLVKLVQLHLAKPDSIVWAGGCPYIDLSGKVVLPGHPFIREPNGIHDWGVDAWFCTEACLFRANTFHLVGGFDERYKTACDFDLIVKLAKFGSFALTEQFVATARLNPQSVSQKDFPEQAISMIASNYLNGYRHVARGILVRYGEQKEQNTLGGITHRDPKLRTIPWLILLKHLVWRPLASLKLRLYQATHR